jgi:hypothetical protein
MLAKRAWRPFGKSLAYIARTLPSIAGHCLKMKWWDWSHAPLVRLSARRLPPERQNFRSKVRTGYANYDHRYMARLTAWRERVAYLPPWFESLLSRNETKAPSAKQTTDHSWCFRKCAAFLNANRSAMASADFTSERILEPTSKSPS